MAQQTDGELIAASRELPDRFAGIFERHHAAIFRYLDRRVGPSEADELVAETFLRAFQARTRYDTSFPDARPWLFGIATNLLRRHWRHERRQLLAYSRTGRDPVVDAVEVAEARIDAEREGPALAAALASLSKDQREVLLLHVYAELSDVEIAQSLQIPVGTVRSRLSRARAHLRERITANGK